MEQLKAALIRGIILSFIATGAALGTALIQIPPLTTRSLIAICISTFFGGLLSRLGEGTFDGIRQAQGKVLSSDVKRTT